MSRDYVTGNTRLSGGPAPGTGEEDVQMAETTDLLFGDNEELKFGDDSDVSIKWDASNLTILPLTDLTGAIQIGNGTLSMDLKVFGTVAGNYIEWDASEDQLNIVVASRAFTGKDIAVNISMVGTTSAGDYVIGLKSEVTPAGTGAIYGMAVQGILNLADAAVSGYACAAEFRMVSEGAWNLCDNAVLVLSTDLENAGSPPAAVPYIMLREYGSQLPANVLVRFFDHTRATANNAVIISQVTDLGPFNTSIRCMVGTTPVWLYGSTVGPTTFEMAWSGAVRNKGLNFNDATFEAGSNYNLLSYGDYGNTVTLSITDYCFVMRMNVTSAANPGTGKWFSFLNLAFAQSTEHQANLNLQGINIAYTLTKNTGHVNVLDIGVIIGEAMACTGELYVAKFKLEKTGIPTADRLAVVRAEVAGSAGDTPSPGVSSCYQAWVNAVSSIDSIFDIANITGCTITSAIRISSLGTMTYFLDCVPQNGVASVLVGAACKTDASAGVASDGAIKIRVNAVDYFIPFYTAGNTTNSW